MRYNRTQASRIAYGACVYGLLVGWPLWLKLITLSIVPRDGGKKPWTKWASVDFVGDPLGTSDNCAPCRNYPSAVNWPLQVKTTNTSAKAEGAQYVITFTADKFKGQWIQSSQPSILNMVTSENENKSYDVCKTPLQLSVAPSTFHTPSPTVPSPTVAGASRRVLGVRGNGGGGADDEDALPSFVDASSPAEVAAFRREAAEAEELWAAGEAELSAAGAADRELRESQRISGDDPAVSYQDQQLLECCNGMPGPKYIVACVVSQYSVYSKTKGKVAGPPFDDRCMAVAGVCGASCGTQVKPPSSRYCVDGRVPQEHLVSTVCTGEGDDGCAQAIEDDYLDLFHIPIEDTFQLSFLGKDGPRFYWTQTPDAWNWFFMVMMFMSYVSICVANIPGAGVCGSANERLPTLHTLNQNQAIKDNVKCISFSISASEHKIWVIRNLLGKVASSFIHKNARLYDYFQDEGTRAGCYALWDALCDFLHTERSEDTVGMCKFWAARLRDPAEQLSRGLDTFKKDSEAPPITMSSIERELDVFEDIHEAAPKYSVGEDRLNLLHYAYELYELVNCLRDRRVWTGWDVAEGSAEEGRLRSELDPRAPSEAPPPTAAALRDRGAPARATSFNRGSVGGGGSTVDTTARAATGAGLLAQAFAEREEEAALLAAAPRRTVHLPGFKDWLDDPAMSTFALQWAHSLCDVAHAAKKKSDGVDPFSDEVLAFARKDEKMRECAAKYALFRPDPKDPAAGAHSKGRFRDAYEHQKKTGESMRYDFIVEREVTMGCFRGVFETLDCTLVYANRAKPENRDKDAIKKRNLQPGIYACLNGDIELPTYPAGMSKWEAQRRCYGKVRGVLPDRNVDGRRVRFCELSHLSEDMVANKPYLESLYSDAKEVKSLWSPRSRAAGAAGGDGDGGSPLKSTALVQLPLSVLAPLLRCRGKAGGMNFAVKVLEEREYEKQDADPDHHVPSLTLFAIFDCRHMVTPGFWEQTILHFFRERAGEVHLQPSVKYCQVPQNFIGVDLATDYLDMQNEYLFRYVNCMRDGVGAVTSCGTNCVWAIERGFEYEEKTMIEDTATSHKVLLEGFEGTYHYEKLIFGTPKENMDFLAAIFRWSRGAVQLFWLAVLEGRSGGGTGVPFLWIVLTLVVLPMALTVFGMQAAVGNRADSFYLAMGIWAVYAVACSVAWCMVTNRKYGYLLRYIVLFDNSTYFFNTWPAYFWCLVLPGYMCNFGHIPFEYTLIVVAVGGLLWETLQWLIILEVKGWSIVEGKRPKDISILRSQQMYFVNSPLHGVAFYSGSKSAYRIIFHHHDASSWSSFGHGGPGDWIVNWLIFLVTFECACICSATVQVGLGGIGDSSRVTAFGVGIITAMIFLALVFDPFCILVSGKTRTVTLKHAYFVFWSVMLVLGVLVLGLGVTINTNGTVSNN